jgi:4-hydroxy-2-oxoheptanedioate aldolase
MNAFKQALIERRPQIGLWQALASPYTAEICAGAGYDWLLFDGEHAPNDLQTMLAQLQAVAPFAVEPVVRPRNDDPALIKQYLDMGVRTLLVPMVDSGAQAARVVAATRFPPLGIRGVASSTSRASAFGTKPGYLMTAHLDICLIAQIESAAALDAIEDIAAVEGIDALFIGPGDLAAALGHLGNPRHPVVRDAITDALARIARSGKPAGIFALSPEDARQRILDGVTMVSVGTDIGLLVSGARTLRQSITA